MRNEMGNNNVSGIKEGEKAAAEVPEKPQEAVCADEAETKDFHTKGAELPSNDPSAAKDLNAQRHESNETDKGDNDHIPDSQSQEVSNSVSLDSGVQQPASPDEGNSEKSLESNFEEIMPFNGIPQIHGQSSIQRDTGIEEVEGSNSTDSKSANASMRSLEENRHSSLGKSEEVLKTSITCNIEDKKNVKSEIGREEDIVEFVPKESCALEDKSLEMSISKENYETKSTEDKAGDGLENQDDCEEPLKVPSSRFPESEPEVHPEDSSLDPSAATPELQEKRVVHSEDMNSIRSESENGNNNQDPDQTDSSEQAMNQMIIENSHASTMLHEIYCKENGDENMVKLSCRSGLEKISHAERVKVTHNRSKSVLADNEVLDPMEQFEDTEEVTKMLPTTILISTEFSPTAKHDDEEGAATEKRDLSPSGESNTGIGVTEEDCISSSRSFKWENGHLVASPDPLSNSSALESSKSDKKFKLNVQTTSGTLAETEILSSSSNEQYAIGEASPLPNCKAQENTASPGIESNPEHPVNRVHMRKSPSFDFGLPLDARSEESDRTPLLYHDKSVARTLSGCANVRFQNRNTQTDYGRKSLDYEPVTMEEKTIRMERSDSDVSSASFVSLLKKDENAKAESTPQKQEIHVADKKQEELPGAELALTAIKGRGKRKPRSSLFTACMCCTAAIR